METINPYALVTPYVIVMLFFLMFYIMFIVVCFVYRFDKGELKNEVFKKLYRTPLSFILLIVLGLVLVFLIKLSTDSARSNAVNILEKSEVEKVDDRYIYFNYDNIDYVISSDIFSDINFKSVGSVKYENNVLTIGD